MSASTIVLLLLLLACPLMMLLMHRGHGDKHSTHDAPRDEDRAASTATPAPPEEHCDEHETEADHTGRRRPRASSHH